MKFSALYSPNIMYILIANQNARVIMIIYDCDCDWLNLCADETTQSVRSDFLPSVKMVQLVDVLLMVPVVGGPRTDNPNPDNRQKRNRGYLLSLR